MIGTVVVQADITEPTLNAAVTGHVVNGVGLCPSSLYADMALTVANYLHKQLVPGNWKIHMDVCNMEVERPLIAKKDTSEPQLIRVTANADLSTGQAELKFASVDSAGIPIIHHAHCIVKYGDGEKWLSAWSQIAYLVNGSIRSLQKSVSKGVAQKLSRGTAYRLFASLVDYSPSYRGMDHIVVDVPELEGMSTVNFQTTEKDGIFFCNPYWIDTLAHLSGFIMNGTEATDGSSVFISHGWKHMRFSKPLMQSTTYRTYVKMQEAGKDLVVGDVYIMENNIIIGAVEGLKFQRVPNSLLASILSAGHIISRVSPSTAFTSKPTANGYVSNKPTPTLAPSVLNILVPTTPSIISALKIIAMEAEIELSELQDECVFAEIGIDSLLSLTITGKFREELGLDIQGDLFLTCPTVKALKRFIATFTSHGDAIKITAEPALQSTIKSPSQGPITWTLVSPMSSHTDVSASAIDASDRDILALIKSTICDQTGINVEEVSRDADLAGLGIDSLMAISILGSLREQTGSEIPSTFFQDYPTFRAIEKHLRLSKDHELPEPEFPSVQRNDFKAQSILMQGNPATATKTLFLVPDGSGSATSYATIPKLSKDVVIYGMNSPFMTTPTRFTCGIEKIAELYLDEVKYRQPRGPYNIGGWSAGGIIAYQMVLHLVGQGEECKNLFLFDSPCPVHLEPLPRRLHLFFGSIGLIGTPGKPTPDWLLPHFEYSIKALTEYKPNTINPGKSPRVFAIWATDGVCKNPSDPRPLPQADDSRPMKWLLENRTDFSYNGWDQIIPASQITCIEFPGANHFTMMRSPHVCIPTCFVAIYIY